MNRKPYLCKCGEITPSNFYGNNKSRCKACYRKKYAEQHINRRNETLRLLGNKCAECGVDDKRVLQVDHVNHDGANERKCYSGAKYYRIILGKIISGSRDYQLLCANCNAIKEWEHSSTA